MAQAWIKGFFQLFFMLFFRVRKEGFEQFDQPGKMLIFANHQNYLDPLSIGCYVKTPINAMAKKEIFKNKLFNWALGLCGAFPVDRGNSDLTAIKTAIRVLNEGHKLLIFPEGTRNFTTVPLEVKAGAIMIALKTQSPVVPVFVKGPEKIFGKIIVKAFPPVDLSEYYGKKLDNETYSAIGNQLLKTIYEEHDKYQE